MPAPAIPDAVTAEQVRAAVRALGLAPHMVSRATLTPAGAEVDVYVRDREGRIMHHQGAPLTTTLHLPTREEVPRASADR
ncbi:hypothetical protein [Streptomyces sp. NPDC047046]|uniref:hypothetical protein n=1 Tax=Streptomyces sp. NPDC047046 TaxID=3155378 RepID=UPI0033F3ED20